MFLFIASVFMTMQILGLILLSSNTPYFRNSNNNNDNTFSTYRNGSVQSSNPIFISDDEDDDVIILDYKTRVSPPPPPVQQPIDIENIDNIQWEDLGLKDGILQSLKTLNNGILCKKDVIKLIEGIRKGMHHIIGEYINYNDRLIAMCVAILEIMELKQNGYKYNKCIKPQVLVIAPRRHMALEARDMFMKISKFYELYATALIGGISTYECVNRLKNGMEIITACPDINIKNNVLLICLFAMFDV
ncbi:MAG: hypothetical protein GY755_11360 [Chloroflexi bacterium]|nr:hypothetical protein [Chloroflexota bacterium]